MFTISARGRHDDDHGRSRDPVGRALGLTMTGADLLSEVCDGLFSDYPLAVTPDNESGAVRSMVLMSRDGDDAEFFVLSRDAREGRLRYSLRPWHTEEFANTEIHATDVSSMVLKIVTRGVPIPQHGSLLGWARGDDITALVAFYARYSRASPEPYWAMMPLADSPSESWPPFTEEPLFGCWFWEYYNAGAISSLDDLIAGNPGSVFWVNTKSVLGSDCCAVARDIKTLEGYALRRGRYVYYEALRAGKPVPQLRTLLAATDKADLASRFRRPGYTDAGPWDSDPAGRPGTMPTRIGQGPQRPSEKSAPARFARFRNSVRR
jgi:hypothetical protein